MPRPILFLCFTLVIFSGQALAQQDLPAGISLLENRTLATKISDAQAYLADQRWEAAVLLLQEVADANPSALIHEEDAVFVGAVSRALELLEQLPPPARNLRQKLLGERAALELSEALNPPNPQQLERIAQRYGGIDAGERAQLLLQELWYDRGYPQLAIRHGAGELQPEWQAALPQPKPSDPLMPPVFDSVGSASLPRIRAQELKPAWRFSFNDDAPTADLGHRMAFGNGLGYATNGKEVVALELGSGIPRWHFLGPSGWEGIGNYHGQEISEGASPLTLLAPVLAEGVLLAVIQEPIGIGRSDSYSHIPIRKKLPARRLYAFDASTGDILWKQQVSWLDATEPLPVELAAAPPAIAGGRVYLPVYTASGTVDLDLIAFDLHSGKRLWKRFLVSGTMETNLFGNVLSELACPPPVADINRVFVCTHFGAVCALDAASGNALWTRTYPRTMVRTRQNGHIGNRDIFFHNNPPAYDGKRLVVAPTDSFFAMCLDAHSGKQLQRWPAVSNTQYGTISNLIGLDAHYAWFSGTHVVRLPLSELSTSGMQLSPPLYDYVSVRSSNLNAGAIIRNGILAMSSDGVVDLDPDSLAIRHESLSWESLKGRFIGPAQVTHGLVLLMTSKGIIGFSSPAALLDTLVSRDLDHDLLQSILPLLESVRYDEAPGLGHRVARTAIDLAQRSKFQLDADSLRFLAGRTLLVVGETQRGLQLLASLLKIENVPLRMDAASLILNAQPEFDATSARLEQAIAVLQENPPSHILTRSSRMEPYAASLQLAQVLKALHGNKKEMQRQSLVKLLLMEDPGTLNVEGMPLFQWGQAQLQELLQEPALRAAQQQAASAWIAKGAPGQTFLRAFAHTDAAQDWLQTRLKDTNLSRQEQVKLLSLVYKFGSQQRPWPLLSKKLERSETLPELPDSLNPLVSVKLDGAIPLHAMTVDGITYVFLQDNDLCRILEFRGNSSRLIHTLPFLDESDSLPTLEQFQFATSSGIALLYKNRWVHVNYKGQRQQRILPYSLFNSSRALRIGDFAAVLLRGPGRKIILQLLDLESGTTYLEQKIDATADRYLQMVADSHYLHILQDKSSQVQRINLLHAETPLMYPLPFAPMWDELQSARAFGEGIAIPSKRSAPNGAILIQIPNRPTRSFPLDNLMFDILPTADGIGWWSRPLRSLQADPGPLSLHWIAPNENRPWFHRFLDPAVQIPQLLNRIPRLAGPQNRSFLCLQPAARDQIEVQSLAFGELEAQWTSLVSTASFSNLVQPLPIPQQGSSGWTVLLREAASRRSSTQLLCLLFDHQGLLLDEYSTPSTARSLNSQRIQLLPGKVLLRNGDVITLLGNP